MEESKKTIAEGDQAPLGREEIGFSESEAEFDSFCPSESESESFFDVEPKCAPDLDGEPNEEGDTEEKPLYVPKNKYEKALYRVYCDEWLSEMLRVSVFIIVAITVYSFFTHLLKMLENSPLTAIEHLVITAVPFVTLSVMRRLINAPRPYELLEFYEKKPKEKSGSSFPSRHVFSVFVIATVIVPTNIALGVTLFVLGTLLAVMRVLLGVHFIRDVVAGALIGVVCGALGLITISWI